MRDPRAGASLPTLQLPDRGAWRGSRWTNLLLRSLRAYCRQNDIEGSSLTGRRSDNSNKPRNASSVVGIRFTAKVDDPGRKCARQSGINDICVLEGMIAQGFGTEVERFHGAKSGGSSNATQLVDAKLEVVRAGWLLQYFDIVRRFCWRDRADRLRRAEIY
jgi:hypothetical protein